MTGRVDSIETKTMKAMVLAAGRGERMRPLSDTVPKPLLEVAGKPLIVHLMEALAREGFRELVINHSWLGEIIESALGDGRRFGVSIKYSAEAQARLGTGGGIFNALPLLGDDPFLVVNADVWTDYPYARLRERACDQAHVLLTDNPPHHPGGDFALSGTVVANSGEPMLTFCGIGVYQPAFFDDCEPGSFRLAPLLRKRAACGEVSGEHYQGRWMDIGTPERLCELDALLRCSL